MWTVEIYPRRGFKGEIVSSLCAHRKDGPYGTYWYADVPESKKKEASRMIRRAHAQQRWYKKEWGRSSDYRETFFKTYAPPYRCRYCNKRLSKGRLQVDHLVPVAQAKKNPNARKLLYIRGIKDVNDPRNLVPSCPRCNLRKGGKMGSWYVRGVLGKYRAYWVLLNTARVLAFLFFLFLFLKYGAGWLGI